MEREIRPGEPRDHDIVKDADINHEASWYGDSGEERADLGGVQLVILQMGGNALENVAVRKPRPDAVTVGQNPPLEAFNGRRQTWQTWILRGTLYLKHLASQTSALTTNLSNLVLFLFRIFGSHSWLTSRSSGSNSGPKTVHPSSHRKGRRAINSAVIGRHGVDQLDSLYG